MHQLIRLHEDIDVVFSSVYISPGKYTDS